MHDRNRSAQVHRNETLRDSLEEARCARSLMDGEEAHNQGVVEPPHRKHQLDRGHPAPYRDGDGDMVGRDEGVSAFARGHASVPGAVALLVEEAGHASVRAMHEEPIRVLCLLTCANRQREESQIRHARG